MKIKISEDLGTYNVAGPDDKWYNLWSEKEVEVGRALGEWMLRVRDDHEKQQEELKKLCP